MFYIDVFLFIFFELRNEVNIDYDKENIEEIFEGVVKDFE